MSSSKFVEILDTSDAPYSHENVSLDDVLKETRARSASSSSESNASNGQSSSTSSSSPERSPTRTATTTTNGHVSAVKTRLRGLSLKKPKS